MAYSLRNQIGRAAVPRPTPAMGAVPAVAGTNRAFGAVLTANAGVWNGRNVQTSFRWYRGTASVVNATSANYTVASADSGFPLTVFVSASNVHGSKVLSARTAVITLA